MTTHSPSGENMLDGSFLARLKAHLKAQFRWWTKESLEKLVPYLMHRAAFFPHKPDQERYVLCINANQGKIHSTSPLPVPPRFLWANYGCTVEDYLETGKRDVEIMKQLLDESGQPLEAADRILDLGCAAGRMTRWLFDSANHREIWGTDIWASAVVWCQQNLGNSFHFVTTTVLPHLPFEDRYFGVIYAGSVFTHIDDLADAWFLELRRVLRPGGRLYITINDRNAAAIFEGAATEEEFQEYYKRVGGEDVWRRWCNLLQSIPEYRQFRQQEAAMVTIGRSVEAHVLWDAEYLCRRLEPFYRVLSITPKAYGHQTGVLLERL